MQVEGSQVAGAGVTYIGAIRGQRRAVGVPGHPAAPDIPGQHIPAKVKKGKLQKNLVTSCNLGV